MIDWSSFDAYPENTISCRCGAVFRSHSEAVMTAKGMDLVSRKPCPSCGSTSNAWKAASDLEHYAIGGHEVVGVRTAERPKNLSLYARTQRDFYAKMIEYSRQHGQSEEAIERQITSHITTARSLLDGRCPDCGAPIARYDDYERQQGPTMPGAWVQYRCSTDPPPGKEGPRKCGFMIDLVEGEASN